MTDVHPDRLAVVDHPADTRPRVRRLFFGGIPDVISEEEIASRFESFGKVVTVEIAMAKRPPESELGMSFFFFLSFFFLFTLLFL